MDQFVRERLWTEEINLLSSTASRSNWILGGCLQRNVINVDIVQLSNLFPTDIVIDDYKTTTGWFGQFSIKLTPQLEQQAGARYSTYVAIGRGIPVFPPAGLVVADLANSHRDGRPTGKVGINYQPNEDNLLYVFVSRGYKAGGANSATSSFDPETVWDLEGGWKSTLLDGHVRTQLGAYYNRYLLQPLRELPVQRARPGDGAEQRHQPADGNHLRRRGPGAAAMGCLARRRGLRLRAFEVAGNRRLHQYAPDPRGWQPDPRAAVPSGQPSNPPICFDYGPYTQTASSGPNVYAPEWTFNAGLEYKAHFGGDIVLTPRVNVSYIGAEWTSLAYSRLTDYLPGYTLVSALLTLDLPRQWQVQAYGTNLTDKEFVSGQSGNTQFYGDRRQYGVRIRKTF